MKHLPEVPAILAKLERLQDRQTALMQDLNKSLHIKSLWPEAFATGSPVSVRIGTHTCHEWDQFLIGKYEIGTAYLYRVDEPDGVQHPITAEQFRTLHEMPGGGKSK